MIFFLFREAIFLAAGLLGGQVQVLLGDFPPGGHHIPAGVAGGCGRALGGFAVVCHALADLLDDPGKLLPRWTVRRPACSIFDALSSSASFQ